MQLSYTNAAFYRKSTFGSNFFSPTVLFSRGKNVGIQGLLSSGEWTLQDVLLTVSLYCTAVNDHKFLMEFMQFINSCCLRNIFPFDFCSQTLWLYWNQKPLIALHHRQIWYVLTSCLCAQTVLSVSFHSRRRILPNVGFKNHFVVGVWHVSAKYDKSQHTNQRYGQF